MTSTPGDHRAKAEAEVELARVRASSTLHELQDRLAPRVLARNAAREAQNAGEKAARMGADTLRRNPATFTGLVAAAGLFLARHRIAALFRRQHNTLDTFDVPVVTDEKPKRIKK